MTLQKIIFIDIDGPIISTPQFFIDKNCSLQRTVVNTSAIGILNHICSVANAKIVTNSSHNFVDTPTGTLRDDLVRHGIPKDHFHDTWHTQFPYNNRPMFHPREAAIWHWLENNGAADWLCFDDVKFTDDPRLLVVEFDTGISYPFIDRVFTHWNIKDRKVFIV